MAKDRNVKGFDISPVNRKVLQLLSYATEMTESMLLNEAVVLLEKEYEPKLKAMGIDIEKAKAAASRKI